MKAPPAGQLELWLPELEAPLRRYVRAISSRALLGRHELDDLVQETLLAACQIPGDFAGGAPELLAWLRICAHNRIRNLARTEQRFKRSASFAETQTRRAPGAIPQRPPDELVSAREEKQAVQGALSTLPDAERKILEDLYMVGRLANELRAESGLSPARFRRRVENARERFRRAYLRLRSDRIVEVGEASFGGACARATPHQLAAS